MGHRRERRRGIEQRRGAVGAQHAAPLLRKTADFYYLTGDPVALGVAAVGLALLLISRPGRLIAS